MGFADRREAGVRLAEALSSYEGADAVVLALPRGGVIVGAEVARRLGLPLDLAVAKKIGHPLNPEAAIGAVSEDGVRVLHGEIEALIDPGWLEKEVAAKEAEAAGLRRRYMGERLAESLANRTAILVDDGIATGFTMVAAAESARKRGAAKVVVAVPVSAQQTAERFRTLVDDFVAVEIPPDLYAVGAHYEDFRQITDEQVIDALGVQPN